MTGDTYYEEHWFTQEIRDACCKLLEEQIPIGDIRAPAMALEVLADELGKMVSLMMATYHRRPETPSMLARVIERVREASEIFEMVCDDADAVAALKRGVGLN